MRKQQQVWSEEHFTAKTLPSEMSKNSIQQPAQSVIDFANFLREQNIYSGKIVDIGAGKGRNSFYLAEQGFDIFALDYIPQAIEFIEATAKEKKLQNLYPLCTPIDKVWPFKDDFFDAAVDCFASIDIETKKGREIYKQELFRTLKPNGCALITVVAAEDEIESELIRTSPGPEKNSSIWPDNGKFQKNYDEAELRDFYKEFKIIHLEKLVKPSHKLSKNFIATTFRLVIQKLG
jgi:SAM-dependent methyltransferase